MKTIRCLAVAWLLFLAASSFGAQIAKSGSNGTKTRLYPPPGSGRQAANASAALEAVLNQMDAASLTFKSAEADFVWEQYQRVVDETDTQKGKIYFRRQNKDLQMAAEINSPERKHVVFADGKFRLYQPRIEQLTEYESGKHRREVESFLVMGFGGSGHDLLKAYDVKYLGAEAVDGAATERIDLVPKAPRVKSLFSHIVLWVDTRRDVSLKQQFFEASGDYRVARYSHIKINQKAPEASFRINTNSRTKVVRPES